MPTDGGQAALSGFLYQMVGVLGLKVWAEMDPDSDSEPKDTDILLSLVREGELRHEDLGQDSVLNYIDISNQDSCVLAQFKYSIGGQGSTIGKKEITKIATRLAASVKLAEDQGYQVNRYYLITNRRLGPTSENLIKAIKNSSPNSKEEQILSELEIRHDIPQETFENHLREFSRSFGLYDRETENGISKLVGDLIRNAVAGTRNPLTKEDITSAFTGDINTRSIEASKVRDLSREEVEDLIKEWGLLDLDELIDREFLDQIQRETLDRALVIVCGEGGCGKTAVLGQWAYERVNDSNAPNNAFTSIIAAQDVNRLWIIDTVRRWGNLNDVLLPRSGPPEDALKRIIRANENLSHPVLHLGLDGVDEAMELDRRDEIKHIVSWFWGEDINARKNDSKPIATLIVTCRDKDTILERLPPSDGFTDLESEFSVVEVVDFSSAELKRAARKSASDLFAEISGILEVEDNQIDRIVDWPIENLLDSSASFAAEPSVVESLKHPAMWRSFLRLTPSEQEDALKGEKEAINKMSEFFIDWFAIKIKRRLNWINKDDIKSVLGQVALGCFQNGLKTCSKSKFVEFARESGAVTDPLSAKLYEECRISGLIRLNAQRQWYWRHRFVFQYLINGQS